MKTVQRISIEEFLRLPPTIFGTIRWNSGIGMPAGDLCSGFEILVEEHTPTEYRAIGGGKYEPIPGTGIFKVVKEALSCRALAAQGDQQAISFHIIGLHLNVLDGYYRITPKLRGNWQRSNLAFVLLGYRAIEPIYAVVRLKESDRIQTVEFEVVRRGWFSRGLLISRAR